jgi:hypothetical protein
MGFFHLNTPRSMLEKAKRELTRLESETEAEHSLDHVFNFFVTAYHIADTLPEPPKAAILGEPLILRCADACNKAKHMQLTRKRPDVATPTHFQAFIGTPNAVDFVERFIVWQDGTSLEVISFARSVIAKWDELILKHGLGV